MGRFLIAALGGAGAAGLVWLIAGRQLDRELDKGVARVQSEFGVGEMELQAQLTAGRQELIREIKVQVRREVPSQVAQTLTRTLNSYGITQNTMRRVNLALVSAERAGII